MYLAHDTWTHLISTPPDVKRSRFEDICRFCEEAVHLNSDVPLNCFGFKIHLNKM